MTIDLRTYVNRGPGIAWSQASEDFNLNFMVLDAGGEVAEHVNAAVDVLLVAVEGEGEIVIDGGAEAIGPGQIALIPKGARRSIHAGANGFAYLLCHRRRPGLWPGPLQPADR